MKALIIIANHFEDSQLLVPLYWLQEEGIKVDIVSMKKGMLKVMRGYEAEAGKTIDEVGLDDYSIPASYTFTSRTGSPSLCLLFSPLNSSCLRCGTSPRSPSC